MLITGTLKKISPLVEYGNNGKRKGQFVIQERQADKARDICFIVFEKTYASVAALKAGDEITVDFTLESREWKEKYYTDAIAWSVIPKMVNASAASGATQKEEFRVPDNNKDYNDDLPF